MAAIDFMWLEFHAVDLQAGRKKRAF